MVKRLSKLPREQARGGELPTDMGPTDQDVEGHIRLPGTGGDLTRLPGTGGDFMPRLPETGGDLRRPSGGGEATDDDIEGHRQI